METVKFTELDIKPEILKACLLKKSQTGFYMISSQ